MKLLTVNYECPPQGGGAGAVMLNLMEQFRRRDDVDQAAICGWDFRYGAAPDIPGVALTAVPVKRTSLHKTGVRAIGGFLRGARRAMRATPAGTYDIVHFHFSVPTGLLARYVEGAPYVCSLHGIDVPGFVDEASMLQRLMAPLNRRVVRAAACVFAPSRAVAAQMSAHCPAAHIEIIPHGVAIDRIRYRSQYAPRPRRFVTIARLLDWKRVDHVVAAIAALRQSHFDVTLDIFGDGEEADNLRAQISAARAESYITLHGMVAQEKLYDQLCDFDVFVLPSVSEAFGLVFLEAMAAGLPVVAYNGGGAADVVEPGLTGLLLQHDDAAELQAALRHLLDTAGLAADMGRRARAAACARFSWAAIAQQYLNAYEAVLSRAPSLVK